MAIKYSDPDWGKLFKQELKARKLTYKQLGKGLGKSEDAVRMLLGRENFRLPSVRKLSRYFGKDYVEYFLSDDSKLLLSRARNEGIHPGEAAIQAKIDAGVAGVEEERDRLLATNEALEARVMALEDGLAALQAEQSNLERKQKESKAQLEEERNTNNQTKLQLDVARSQIEELKKKHASELNGKEKAIGELKDAMREQEYEARLKISVLEAKLETLREGR